MLSHFFNLQKVLPRRIQQKYFNLIRCKLLERIDFIKSRASNESLNNKTTRTFFSFSYKRYRFHFGIYVPCDHFYAPGLSKIASRRRGPSPFIMSSNNSFDIPKKFSLTDLVLNVSPPTVPTFNNPSTSRKQKARFKRQCARVFKYNKLTPITTLEDKLAAGRRYRFLFLKSQHIYSVIHHLKYKFNNLSNNQSTSTSSSTLKDNPSQPTEVLAQFLSPSEIAALGRFLESLPKSFPFVRGHNPVDTTRLGWNYYLQYNPDLPHLPPNICIRSPDDDAVDASFANNNGTSLKHFHRRSATTSQLTTYNNSFHEHMKWASQPTPNNKSRKWKRL
ncbi:hypothetical protein GLOIN_2v1792013 [Rhizophagus irregularis DAOM 181602=DAOM 197198]|nr:hypothetical protein GLOIN_2v1792013 [Rhizophagus irregularis DAOM 181602=DAOM 197198]